MLEIQKFLQNNTLSALNSKYGIRVSLHKDFSNLHCFKYNMIESPMSVPLVREARGLILDSENDWAVVSYPYQKFFNAGEGYAAKIDWASAVSLDKLDGSLMTLYHYNDEWRVATSGMADADGSIHPMLVDITFKKLFWKIWEEMGYKLPTNTDECYMFEMMTKYNRVVCQYNEDKIVFHGARNIKTHQELPYTYGKELGWEIVKAFPITTLSELFKACKLMNPINNEGFVVVDKYFNRIKVKSPQYVAISLAKEGMSAKRLMTILFTNETDEFLSYFPEFAEVYGKLKTYYHSILQDLEKVYAENKAIKIDKEFAIAICKHQFKAALFNKRRYNNSFKSYFSEGNIKSFIPVFMKGIKMTEKDIENSIEEASGYILEQAAIVDKIDYNTEVPAKERVNLFPRKGGMVKRIPTMYFMRGLPASGKSTKAKELMKSRNNIVRLSMDDIRAGLFDVQKDSHCEHSYDHEKITRKLERNLALTYLQAGVDVIIDDTNLVESRVMSFMAVANQFKADFVEIDFFHIPPAECIERNKKRSNPVPEDVIQNMADKYIDEDLWK